MYSTYLSKQTARAAEKKQGAPSEPHTLWNAPRMDGLASHKLMQIAISSESFGKAQPSAAVGI
jgi:hypothetical protein